MLIYKITNKLNGKSYIGQTRKTVAERIRGHIYNRSSVGKEIIANGKENFDISVIDCADTQEEIDELERFWISFYNTCETGYNTLIGGKPTKKEFKMISQYGNKTKDKASRKHSKRFEEKQKEKMRQWLAWRVEGKTNKRVYVADKVLYDECVKLCGKADYPFPENGKLTRIQRMMIKQKIINHFNGVV